MEMGWKNVEIYRLKESLKIAKGVRKCTVLRCKSRYIQMTHDFLTSQHCQSRR